MFGFSWTGIFVAVWHYIVAAMDWICSLVMLRFKLPLWSLVLLVVFGLVLRRFLRRRQPQAVQPIIWSDEPTVPAGPRETDYTQDRFLGAIWRWNYFQGRVNNPSPFCPQCDNELLFVHNHTWGLFVGTSLRCEHCGWESTMEANYTQHQLISRIEREIRRNLRTGDWRRSVAQLRQ
jgi:hypothetical protein